MAKRVCGVLAALLACASLARGEQAAAGLHTEMRQVPFEVPLRLPFLVAGPPPGPLPFELGSPLDEAELGSLGPMPLGALPMPMRMQEMPLDIPRPMPIQDAPPQIQALMRALAGAAEGHAPPELPFPADGLRLKVRRGEGIPAPLSLEHEKGKVRIVGQLPRNLNASALKVSQLGHVVNVQYRLSDAAGAPPIGVEQRFELAFEPEHVAEAHYKQATGHFELLLPEPATASKPKEVKIVFDTAPLPSASAKRPVDDSHTVIHKTFSKGKQATSDETVVVDHVLKAASKGHADNLKVAAPQKPLHVLKAAAKGRADNLKVQTPAAKLPVLKAAAKGRADNLKVKAPAGKLQVLKASPKGRADNLKGREVATSEVSGAEKLEQAVNLKAPEADAAVAAPTGAKPKSLHDKLDNLVKLAAIPKDAPADEGAHPHAMLLAEAKQSEPLRELSMALTPLPEPAIMIEITG